MLKRSETILKEPNAIKILFVCSRNRRRSLSAEQLFGGRTGFDVRSAGTQPTARVPVTEGLLRWADVVLMMEKSHLNRLGERYGEVLEQRETGVLHIPDDYEFMQEELVDELLAKAEPYFVRDRL